MTAYTAYIIEITALVGVWLLATGLSRPMRKRLHQDNGPGLTALAADLLAHILRPGLVLVLGRLLLVAVGFWPSGQQWIAERPAHVTAWNMFWIGVVVVALIEGMAQVGFRRRGKAFPLSDLLLDILRSLLLIAVGLGSLRWGLGISIGPLLASTALVTAVVGFALQGVLGNLLAGLSMHLVSTLRPGIWIDVDGVMGKVIKTNWRETRVRTPGGHLYIFPNARIAETRIHNFNEPTSLRRHTIEVGASYSDAPDEVIAALLQAARDVPEVRTTPAPEALITQFQDYGINYRLTYWTTTLHLDIQISGHINRNIWYRFQRQGIEIPFPMSDKLLNDFMAVVYNQRKLPPQAEETSATLKDLLSSDLGSKVLVDSEGQALVSESEWEKIAPLVRRQPYTTGEIVCRQGDAGDSFWVLAQGRLRGRVVQDGQVAAEFDLLPGAVVGEMSLLTGAPRSATLTTTSGSELLEFGPEAFKALLQLYEDLPENLSRLAAARAQQNRQALEDLSRLAGLEGSVVLEQKGILRRLLGIVGRR